MNDVPEGTNWARVLCPPPLGYMESIDTFCTKFDKSVCSPNLMYFMDSMFPLMRICTVVDEMVNVQVLNSEAEHIHHVHLDKYLNIVQEDDDEHNTTRRSGGMKSASKRRGQPLNVNVGTLV